MIRPCSAPGPTEVDPENRTNGLPGEAGERSPLRCDGLQIGEKGQRGLKAGWVAPPFVLGLDRAPCGRPPPLQRVEPGTSRVVERSDLRPEAR